MDKKLQVFVSSTYEDLIDERQVAVEAILDAGHIPAGMELFKAGKSQMKTIYKWIDESDAYLLILGGRYGSIEEESGFSYTEIEYNYALSKNMPVFAIILDESFLFTKAAHSGRDAVFENKNVEKYYTFKTLVKNNVVKFVKNIDQISSVIHSHLNDILRDPDYHLVGWIRNNHENDIFTLIKLNEKLNQENLTLNRQIQDLQNQLNKRQLPQYGNYTFQELVDILKHKWFQKPDAGTSFQETALDIFIEYYHYLYNGIPNQSLGAHINYYFINNLCPYFYGYQLLSKSNENGMWHYEINEIGAAFYSEFVSKV